MRHAVTIAEGPLAISVVLSPVVRALVPAASFATPRPIPCNPTLDAAVALAAIVSDADVEQAAAVEALDLDKVDRIRPGHAAARRISTTRLAGARLYSSRGRASTSLRRLPGRPVPGRSGASTPPAPNVPPPWPPTTRPRRGLWRGAPTQNRSDDQIQERLGKDGRRPTSRPWR